MFKPEKWRKNMRKFKKFAATMLVGLMATTALAGCSKSNNAASGNTDGKEGSVLTFMYGMKSLRAGLQIITLDM